MSKEKLKNKNHGITLIALIITVIVLLILVGVTLSVTLGDNGLVNKAKEATVATEIAMDRELLLSAVVGTIDSNGEVNLSAIVLPEGFTGSNGNYTSKNGHTFNVGLDGTVTYVGGDNETNPEAPESSSEDLELLKRYFMGEVDISTGEREEINAFALMKNPEVTGNGNYNELKFIDNDVIPKISEDLTVLTLTNYGGGDSPKLYMYFEYKSVQYVMDIQPISDDYAIVKKIELKLQSQYKLSDIAGVYYDKNGEAFEIKDNKFIRISGDEKYEVEILSYMFDVGNQFITITTNSNESIGYNYKFIYKDGQFINKIMYATWGIDNIFWQNENGIIADVEGIYVNEAGDRRLVLKPEEKNIQMQYLSSNGIWYNSSSNMNGLYLKVDGEYWIDGGWNMSIIQNENTLLYEGQTYTKVNE